MSIRLRFDRGGATDLPGWRPWVPALEPVTIAPDVAPVARRAWAERMRSEYIGVMMMRHLHGLLVDLNAPMDLQEAALAMTLHEQAHVRYCAEALVALGGEPSLDFEIDELQFPRSDRSLDQQLLEAVITTFCAGEVVAMALIRATLAEVPDSPFRELLKAIARDEVLHARFGSFLLRSIRYGEGPRWLEWPGDDAIRALLKAAVEGMRRRDVIDPREVEAFADSVAAQALRGVGIPEPKGFLAVYHRALDVEVPAAVAFLDA